MELSPSQIATLVLGYLRTEKCVEAMNKFIDSCQHFENSREKIKTGKFVTRVYGMSLTEYLEEYATISSIVQEKLENTNYYNEKGNKTTLVDQLLYLLDTGIILNSTPITSEVETTPSEALPGNAVEKEDRQLAVQKTPTTPPRRRSMRNRSREKSQERQQALDVSEVWTQTLLENTELHARLAETINSAVAAAEKNRAGTTTTPASSSAAAENQPPDSNVSMGASKELDAIIKTVVQRTEEDPVYNKMLDDLFECAPTEDTHDHNKKTAQPSTSDVPRDGPSAVQAEESVSSRKRRKEQSANNKNSTKKPDHPGPSEPHLEQQTTGQVPSAIIDQLNQDAISSIIAVSNVGSSTADARSLPPAPLPPPQLPPPTSTAALVVVPPPAQQQETTPSTTSSLSSSSLPLSSAVLGVAPNETEVGGTAALGASGDVTFFNGSLHKYLKASGGSCYNAATVVSAVPNQLFLNTTQCTQLLVLPPTSSSLAAPQQYEFQPAIAALANGGQPSVLGIGTIPQQQHQQQQQQQQPSSDNNVVLLSDADIMQMPTVIVNDGSPPTREFVTVNQLRTDVGAGDRGRSRYVHIAPKPTRSRGKTKQMRKRGRHHHPETHQQLGHVGNKSSSSPTPRHAKVKRRNSQHMLIAPRDKSSNGSGVANVVPGRDMVSLSPPHVATLMPKKPTPKHVRNLDFSTPPEPEQPILKKKSSWDADLRQMVANCKDKTPPRIRKVRARRRLARAKDQAKVEGEDDNVANEPTAEEPERAEVEENCEKEADSSNEKTTNQDSTTSVDEAKKTSADNDGVGTKEEATKNVQQCTDGVVEPENNNCNPETETDKTSRQEKEDPDQTIVQHEEQQAEKNGRDFDQLMTVVNREKMAFVPPVTPLKDGIPSTTLNASYNSLTPFTQVLEDQLKGVDLCAIPTPKIPITPGFALTPLPDQEHHRLTDYSTSSSYYLPSDTEQNKSIEQLIEESRNCEDRSAQEKSPNKLKILSDVVVQHCKPMEIAKSAEETGPATESTSAISSNEHLKKFNQKVIGKKNINLEHPPPLLSSSSSDDESSSTDSDSSDTSVEEPTVIQNRSNSTCSETARKTTEITSIIQTVEMKTTHTLVLPPTPQQKQPQPRPKTPEVRTTMAKPQEVSKDLEEKPQKTINKMKTPSAASSSAETGRRKPSQKQQSNKQAEGASDKGSKPRTAKPKTAPQKNKSENSKPPARRRKDSEPKSETATDDQSKKMVTDLWQRGIHLVPNKTPVKQTTSTEPSQNNSGSSGDPAVPPKQPPNDPEQKVSTRDADETKTDAALPPQIDQPCSVDQTISKDPPSSTSSAVLPPQKQQELTTTDQLPPASPSYSTTNFGFFSTTDEIRVTHDEKNTIPTPFERRISASESFKIMVSAEGFGDFERTMRFTPIEFLLDMSSRSGANVSEPRRSKRVQNTGHKKPNYVVDGPSPEKTQNLSPERSRGGKLGENSKTSGSTAAGEKTGDKSPDRSSKNSKKRKARLSEDEPKPQQEKKPKCTETLLTNMNIDEFLDQIHGVN